MTPAFPDWENPYWYDEHHDAWLRTGEQQGLFYQMGWEALPGIDASHSVLDLGTGTGHFAQGIVKRYPAFNRLALLDIRSERLELACSRVKAEGFSGKLESHCCPISNFTAPGAFQLVTAFLSLRESLVERPPQEREHASEALPKLLAKIRGFLTPGGYLIWGETVGYIEPLETRNATPELLEAWEAPEMLKAQGFVQAECIFRHRELAIFRAQAED